VSTRPIGEPAVGQGTCPADDSAKRFRTVSCNNFACAPGEGRDTLVCDAEVDVIILLDGSGSLGQAGWAATKAFGKKLVAGFNNADANVTARAQVAVQLFSGPSSWWQYWVCVYGPRYGWYASGKDCGIEWVTPMSDKGHFSVDMTDASSRIEALDFPAKSTLTSMALMQAKAELVYGRQGVDKVVVVVTDGWPMNWISTGDAAKEVKQAGARLVWVPVTSGAPLKMLKEWATAPAEKNVVHVADFEAMGQPSIVTEIIADVCPEAK
jgi:hypothetical protein